MTPKSPYNARTLEHREWVRGYEDRIAGRPFKSLGYNAAKAVLAYNEGWKTAGEQS